MIISDYILYQNYPNPFNPTTKIAYRLKESGYVKLYVYDIKGELISILVNQQQLAGFYEVEFFSSSIQHTQSSIKDIASGVYIYQLLVKSENNIPVFTDIKKMIYIK
jgi:competence CoiA-like predicted nuclease